MPKICSEAPNVASYFASILLLGHLNSLEIGLDSKNGVVLEFRHFRLSTGAKK